MSVCIGVIMFLQYSNVDHFVLFLLAGYVSFSPTRVGYTLYIFN